MRRLVLAASILEGTASAEAQAFGEANRQAIARALQASVAAGDLPVIVAAVFGPKGELYKGAFGKLDVKQNVPATADGIFQIASMTKAVTSVATMMLVEQKRVALDESIDTYLGAHPRVIATYDDVTKLVSTRPLTADITVRQLLTNTSGIAYAFSNDVMHRVRETASSIEETDILVHEPGERWTYGPNAKLLGEIVAKVSGQPLDVFFEQRIFEPLGMVDTGFVVAAENRARAATLHVRRETSLVERPNDATLSSPVRGDGGLYSTASDFGRFLRMLLNGGQLDGKRLLAEATVKQMMSNQIGQLTLELQPSIEPAFAAAFPRGAGRDKFGFGFQISQPDGPSAGRRGAGSASWAGAYNTYFWIDPSHKLAAVFLTQVLPFGDEAATRALDAFESAVYTS